MATSETHAQAIDTPRTTFHDRLAAWKEIMQTANPPAELPLDTVGKWLVITRAAVFPMTIWSGTIGALLAAETARVTGLVSVDWLAVILAIVGLVIAHAANNMINDYFDTSGGVDTEGYVRALYAPHPILTTRNPPSRRRGIRHAGGRCGSSASRSSTRAWQGACSRSGS